MPDDQAPLPPIPVPPAQRWREVRLLYLPRTVFALGVVGVVLLWSRWVAPATIVAEAEAVQAEVRSAQAGTLLGLKVAAFQEVQANEVLGHVATVDPKLLEATLAVIRAEVGMLSSTMAGATDRLRVALEFERLQVEWMTARVELAALRGKLQVAEGDLDRMTPLHRSGVVSEENFAQLKAVRDSLVEQVAEQTKLVARLEPAIRSFAGVGEGGAATSPDSALATAIKVQDAKLKLAEQQLTPVPLVSPIAGVVAAVFRRTGEAVVAGEPILRITAKKPDRLSGFMRQPLPFEPKVGMPVEIRSRAGSRQSARAAILNVGAGMETLTPSIVAAMRLPPAPLPEPGLRIQIAIPEGFVVKPGEFVDVLVP
ncbi:MAG: hypothetical protein HZC55_24735 [Verrucomicrobia bacterium]|nr:hypothetical protein [Verrucomicrobiota bacterium]